MHIITIGSGFVGATHSAVLASHGHTVLAYDLDSKKIAGFSSRESEQIDSIIYEPGLAHLIKNHHNLSFTTDINEIRKHINSVDVIFLCLPTPASELALPDEKKFLFIAAKNLSEILKTRNDNHQTKYILLVNKSTVPIGTAEKLKTKLAAWGVKNFGIASNPEFLVEGKAVSGSQNPDRIVIGVAGEQDEKILRDIYLNTSSTKIKVVKPADAEAIKLVANFELFSTVVRTFQIAGRLCETLPGLTFENVIMGITADSRIPKWGHYTSLYSGGSCFEKDAYNLIHTLSEYPSCTNTTQFIKTIIDGNNHQLTHFYNRAKKDANFSFSGKTVALLGLAFKQDTNDVRMSPALPIAEWLNRDGVERIYAYDPQAGKHFAAHFAKTELAPKIHLCASAHEALLKSDCAIICTDWPEFKFLAPTLFTLKKPYLIMDGRRTLAEQYSALHSLGITVIAVGSPTA